MTETKTFRGSKPLYVFKFDEVTGEIKRFVIRNYKEIQLNYHKVEYVFQSDEINKEMSYFAIRNDKLDRFVSGKVVTFHDDYEMAYKTIEDTIHEKINDYQRKVKHQTCILKRLMMNGK